MSILKKSVGVGVIVCSVLGLLLCLAGTIGVWWVKGRVENLGTVAFSALDDSLGYVNVVLERAKSALGQSRERVGWISKTVERWKAETIDVGPQAETLLQAMNEAFQELREAEDDLDSCHAFANGFSRVADTLLASDYAAVHAESGAIALLQRTQDLSQAVAEALAKLQVIRQELIDLHDSGKLVAAAGARIVAQLIDLDGRLTGISSRLEKLTANVTRARSACVDLGQTVLGWILFGTVCLTLLLAWFAISQLNMTRQGWRLTHAD